MIQRWIDAIRRNHGLEHATVAVLIARHGPRLLAGRASSDGVLTLRGVGQAGLVRANLGRRLGPLAVHGLASLAGFLLGFELDSLPGSFRLYGGCANQLLGISAGSSKRVAGENPVKDPPQH